MQQWRYVNRSVGMWEIHSTFVKTFCDVNLTIPSMCSAFDFILVLWENLSGTQVFISSLCCVFICSLLCVRVLCISARLAVSESMYGAVNVLCSILDEEAFRKLKRK